jgi:hypothetical protein
MRTFWAATIFLIPIALTSALAQQIEGLTKTVVLHEGETVTVRAGEMVLVRTAVPVQNVVSVRKGDSEASRAAKRRALQFLPRPFVYAGPGFMPGGYAPLAALGGVGLRIDARRLLMNFEGSYDNGHKVNDNDQPNPKGHDRGLAGSVYYRLSSGWFLGAGGRWSQLSTTKYTKTGARPTFGGGKDYFHRLNCDGDDESCVHFSMRISVDYVLKGNDYINGSQGPLVTFYMPSPSAKGHFFFRQTLGIYTFYTTVTEPNNAYLTRLQMNDRHAETVGEMTFMYRF